MILWYHRVLTSPFSCNHISSSCCYYRQLSNTAKCPTLTFKLGYSGISLKINTLDPNLRHLPSLGNCLIDLTATVNVRGCLTLECESNAYTEIKTLHTFSSYSLTYSLQPVFLPLSCLPSALPLTPISGVTLSGRWRIDCSCVFENWSGSLSLYVWLFNFSSS